MNQGIKEDEKIIENLSDQEEVGENEVADDDPKDAGAKKKKKKKRNKGENFVKIKIAHVILFCHCYLI